LFLSFYTHFKNVSLIESNKKLVLVYPVKLVSSHYIFPVETLLTYNSFIEIKVYIYLTFLFNCN